jgi:hypothetical protein
MRPYGVKVRVSEWLSRVEGMLRSDVVPWALFVAETSSLGGDGAEDGLLGGNVTVANG